MRKIKQLLSVTAGSLLCIGLSAQSASHHLKLSKMHEVNVVSTKKFIKGANNRKPEGTATFASMQYPMTDMGLQTSYSLTNGWYLESLNKQWTIADTGSGATENFDLNHSATVAFDTIMDYYTGSSYIAGSGSLTVDTISSLVTYKNTSGKNDTLVFFITNVLANGYPGSTVLHTDTIFLNKGLNLPGNSLDTIYQVAVLPNFGIASGYKFAVTMQFSGPKVDTFQFAFAFPISTCSVDGSAYCNAFTYIGPAFGPTPACNSFVNGWEYYESPTYAPITWPDMQGNQVGILSGSPFDNDEWSMCGADTEYFYWQDNAIYAGVSFTNVTGINTIQNNGLSVNQNYPNPFTQTSRIDYSVTKSSDIAFSVYDVTGRVLVNNHYSQVTPGQHYIMLDAATFRPGIYFYTFTINGIKVTKKMVISE